MYIFFIAVLLGRIWDARKLSYNPENAMYKTLEFFFDLQMSHSIIMAPQLVRISTDVLWNLM